jgi:hypothetical protein
MELLYQQKWGERKVFNLVKPYDVCECDRYREKQHAQKGYSVHLPAKLKVYPDLLP